MSTLPDYDQALGLATRGVTALNRFERVDLAHAAGRVLAEPVIADRDLPPFNRAQMDGYAIRASEFSPGRLWRVAHTIAAGSSPEVSVLPGECVAIATGAAIPAGLDTVIPHEQSDCGDKEGRPVRFTIETIAPGHAVHQRGADARTGSILTHPGTLLAAHHVGIAASVGATTLSVHARPRAAVFTSGDEIVPPQTPLSSLLPHQVRNSNGFMACELLRRFGADPTHAAHLPDDRDATVRAVSGVVDQADVIVTIGGVSAGDRDHFPAAFAASNVQTLLQGARIQPGQPIFVGRAPGGAIVIGLPGNPVSVLACACLFAWPIVRLLSGCANPLPWQRVELAKAVKPNANRRAFRPALMLEDGRVEVPSWAGSGDLAHTANTTGLLELPVQPDHVAAGAHLRYLPWP